MVLHFKTERSLVSRKLAWAIFAVFALFVQPLVALDVPSAFAAPVINEVMANPVEVGEATTEWIELKNDGDSNVDISGWTVAGATVPSGQTIVAGGLYVLCKSIEAMAECDGVSTTTMSLPNTGTRTIQLKDTNDAVIDEFTYNSTTDGQSIEVVKEDNTSTGTNNDVDSYQTNQSPAQSGNTGTPGAANRLQPTAKVKNKTTGEYFTTLQAAINDSDTVSGNVIQINGDLSVASQTTVSKSVTIDGNGHTLSPTFTKTDNANNAVIGVIGTNSVTIKDLTIDGSGGTNLHGVNLYEAHSINLNSLTIRDNDRYGVVVNSSSVTIDSIATSGNGWGGVNVDMVTQSAHATMTGNNSHDEVNALFVEGAGASMTDNTAEGQYYEYPAGSGIYHTKQSDLGPVVDVTSKKAYDTVQAAIDDSSTMDGDKITVKNGDYAANNINVTKGVEIVGESEAGTVLTVPNVSGTNGFNVLADGVTIRNMTIKGPADGVSYKAYAWGGTVTRGIFVYNGYNDFEITGNTIKGLRNNILIDGRNQSGLVTGNVIDNSKSGISVQYTDAGTGNAEGYDVTISGNTEGTFGNEWGLNIHLNGHYVGGSYHPNVPNSNAEKIAINAPLAVQTALLANSQANGGWTVQDQGYRYQNRTAVNVGGTNASDTNQGSPLGQLATLQAALDAVATGGSVEVSAGATFTTSQQITITRAVTINGGDSTVIADFNKSGNDNNSVVGVQSDNGKVVILDLTVDAGDASKQLHGINVYESDDVTLTGIAALNGRSGVVVGQGSNVVINDIETSGNAWHGINVDKAGAHLTISGDNSHDSAVPAIFVDDKTVIDGIDYDADQYSVFENGNAQTYVLSSEVSDGDGGTVNLPVVSGVATTPVNQPVELKLGNITAVIPAGTTVTASGVNSMLWNGTILAPVLSSYTISGDYNTGLALTVGSNDYTLTFSKPVRLLLAGQAGKRAGFIPAGGSVFTEITNVCGIDDESGIGAASECKIDVGSDLVIWTKHFTTFVAYSENTTDDGSGSGSTDSDVESTSGSVSPLPAEATTTSATVAATSTDSDDSSDVLGTKTNDGSIKKVAVIAPSEQGWMIWGVAWYWYLLAIGAVGGATYYALKWYRGRQEDF